MKTAQDILNEKGIPPRQVIFDVLNKIVNESRWKLSPPELTDKIVTWHEELVNFDDNRISSGLKSALNLTNDSIPSIGVFKNGCRRKEYKAPPPEKEQPWELRTSNLARIKQKLMEQNG